MGRGTAEGVARRISTWGVYAFVYAQSQSKRQCDMAAQVTASAIALASGSVSATLQLGVVHDILDKPFTARETSALASSQAELCNNRAAVSG